MSAEDLTNARILWVYHNQAEPLAKADLIVGLGSYDLRVADYCAALYGQSLAPNICFTGASGNWTSGLYETSEAAAFAERAIELGVPSSQIHVEDQSKNIGENIDLTRRLFPAVNAIIWVTKPQTQRRVRATLDVRSRNFSSMVTAPNHELEAQPTASHTLHDLICELVGDSWRILAYPDLGFMAEQHMPDVVRAAYLKLVAAGFTDHLPDNVATSSNR